MGLGRSTAVYWEGYLGLWSRQVEKIT